MSRRLIVCAGRETREFVLVGTIVVGRDPACDISDAGDPLLSRRHAEFSNANEAMVRDLGSRNGILVNGVKTPQAVLRAGDVVQVGQLQVKFVDELGPLHGCARRAAAGDGAGVRRDECGHGGARSSIVSALDLDVTKKLP